MTFHLTEKQLEAQKIMASDASHIMLFGGSRSGKTFLIVRNLVMRGLKAPKSRHAMFRYRFNAIKSSVIQDTFPKVMSTAFAGLPYELNKTDNFATLPNGSEIWFAGLDEKERAEKVLGMEFVTIALNECSQIPKAGRDLVLTRLAQQVMQELPGQAPTPLKPRMYYDENPPSKGHWTYKLFIQKTDPETKEPLPHPDDYAWFKINPQDNADNISDGYLDTLRGMSARFRQRFLDGEFTDDNPNALFTDTTIETWRVMDGAIPQMVRVVVAVDPSGADDEDNADNDAIGIIVAGLGVDGNAYLLEDCTVKAGPATWGKIATDAYDRHRADCIVGETNYGGEMVRQTILTARPRTPFKKVSATRGKHVRAEPFSALYEQGKVRHVGLFAALEDELTAFSTFGYTGQGSPNRADAAIWALSELFPGLIAGPKQARTPRPEPRRMGSWAA